MPADAIDIVFDDNRPSLNLMTARAIGRRARFDDEQLTASGWLPLSTANAGFQISQTRNLMATPSFRPRQ